MKYLSIVVVAILMLGCATVTKGTRDTLVVESTPENAQVQLSTGQACLSTPCAIEAPRNALSITVTVSKKGCETRVVNVVSSLSTSGGTAFAGNLLLGGLIGAGVDSYTGAAREFKPNPLKVTLEC